MENSEKPVPKSQYELSTGETKGRFSRANDVRQDDDGFRGGELNIGLRDIDYAIKWYFENVMKPEVLDAGVKIKVPVIYGSPEKWKNMQEDGYFRDKNGKIQCPLIAFKRNSISKNRNLANKVDANYPHLYWTQEVKYSQQNRYDRFSVLTNAKPVKTFINTIVPEYLTISYDVTIWTDYVDQMNSLVESVLYSEGAYWGEESRFKFRTSVEGVTNTTDLLQDSERTVRTTFTLNVYGYIVPDVLVKQLSDKLSEKTFSIRQIQVETLVDDDVTSEILGQKVDDSEPYTRVVGDTNITQYSGVNSAVLSYINTNKTVQAATISVPDTITLNADILTAPSPLPATSAANFVYVIEGQTYSSDVITSFTQTGPGAITIVFNTSILGFTLAASDTIYVIGKFS